MLNIKSRLAAIIALLSLFFNLPLIYSTQFTEDFPLETVILNPQTGTQKGWKEISRSINKNEVMIELIPETQDTRNWSELIAFQYFSKKTIDKAANTVENIISRLKDTTLTSYPGGKVSWNIVEKSDNDFIYEWKIQEKYKHLPSQYEMARGFLTKKGFHRVGITVRGKQPTPQEKETWLKALRESADVVSLQTATDSFHGLSMVERIRDSFDIHEKLPDWTVANMFYYPSMECSLVAWIPPSQVGLLYIDECIEIFSIPANSQMTTDGMLEIQKSFAQKHSVEEIDFEVLKQTPTEIIYISSYPKDHLLCNLVVRGLLFDQTYYTVSYMRGLTEKLSEEEILKWKNKLETLEIHNRYKDIHK